jgi:hypothetical protein
MRNRTPDEAAQEPQPQNRAPWYDIQVGPMVYHMRTPPYSVASKACRHMQTVSEYAIRCGDKLNKLLEAEPRDDDAIRAAVEVVNAAAEEQIATAGFMVMLSWAHPALELSAAVAWRNLDAIRDAIKSGDEQRVRSCVETYGRDAVDTVRMVREGADARPVVGMRAIEELQDLGWHVQTCTSAALAAAAKMASSMDGRDGAMAVEVRDFS